jgi:ATP-binding cassette subfamily B protein
VLRTLVGLLLVAVVVRLGLEGVQSYNVQAVGQRLTARIRNDLFAHALELSLRFHDRTPVGKLLTRLTSDVDALAEVFGSGAVGVLADLVTLLVIAVTMISIEPRLGVLLLASQVPVTMTILWLQGRYRKANYTVREELGQLNADLQENLQGLEVVQMFRREAYNSARFARTTNAYRKAVDGTIFFDSAISALIEWVALTAIAVVLALGGWMVSSEVMGLGTLTTFILYSQRLFDPLRQLAERFTQIQGGLTAVERIGELFEEPVDIQELPQSERSEAAQITGGDRHSPGEVVFENVSFAYRSDDPILEDLSFRIAPGEHVALVGPTGSGKTTVIRLLCRLTSPSGAGSCSMASTSASYRSKPCANGWGWCSRTPSCSAETWPTTCAWMRTSAIQNCSGSAMSWASTPCSAACPRVSRAPCANGAATSPRANANCSRWPGWASATPRCW